MRLRIHVFHISLLEPAPKNTPLETTLEVDPDDEEYEVETVLDSRIVNGKLEYLVKWESYGPEDNSWEPASHLKNSSRKTKEFHQRNPDRPGPTRGRKSQGDASATGVSP
jgi:hypothetical protein